MYRNVRRITYHDQACKQKDQLTWTCCGGLASASVVATSSLEEKDQKIILISIKLSAYNNLTLFPFA